MAIFKYELRQMRGLILGGVIAFSVLLFCLLPPYISITTNPDGSARTETLATVDGNSFLQAVDISAEFLSKPIGMYGFLTGWFFGLALAVIAMHIGLSIHTKEYMQGTADFLLTKPHNRTKIFISKLFAAAVAVLSIGVAYFLASLVSLNIFAAGFDFKLFVLLACSIILNSVLFMSFGFFLGTILPKIRKSIFTSVITLFITIIIGTMAQVTGADILIFLSPPKYFGGSIVADMGGYDMRYVVWLIFLVIAFTLVGSFIYRKKDVVIR
ncbi:MAG: ABC transporter permease [Syntrophomonadaceae bacterium]|jgi:ABC-2 type transport system permease protein|nr:ABC transporter permease [Syntrophomonadaceae bacterium]